MLENLASADDAQVVGRRITKYLRERAERSAIDHGPLTSHPWERKVRSKTVWDAFNDLKKDMTHNVILYPSNPSRGGKAKGEYLVDFMLFDDLHGPRIACESELEERKIDWALDKLRGVKGDIKILVFGHHLFVPNSLPQDVQNIANKYLFGGHFHTEHEFFVFVHICDAQVQAFVWRPNQRSISNQCPTFQPINEQGLT